MQWHRGIAVWLVSVGILGGVVALVVLPVVLRATPTSDQRIPVPSPEPSPYDPEVQHLLETTYLGHAAGLPDPGSQPSCCRNISNKMLTGTIPS
jgi:hypothetical protein